MRCVPLCGEHFYPEANVLVDPVADGRVLDVLADLRLLREQSGPIRIGGKGIRVQAGRDVAGTTGIGVGAPGAAEGVRFLEQDKIVDPEALQVNCCTDPGDPATDDHDLEVVSSVVH